MKNSFVLLVSILSLNLFVSCKDKFDSHTIIISEKGNVTRKVKIDTINIKINENCLDSYKIFTIDNSKKEYIAYNQHTHSIDHYSLINKKLLNIYKLEKNGPNGIIDIQGIQKISRNVIAILTDHFIKFYNIHNNSFEKSIKINNSNSNKYFESVYIYVNNSSQFYYDSKKNSLFFSILDLKKGLDRKGEHYNSPILGFYSISNDTFDIYDEVRFPEEYMSNYYGFNDVFYFSFNHENITYNFSALPKIFNFNYKQKSSLVYELGDINLPYLKTKSLSWKDIHYDDKKMIHFFRNSNFSRFLDLNNSNALFYYSALPDHIKSYDDFTKKEIVFILLSNEFDFIKNIKLKGPYNINDSFSIANSIYVNFLNKENHLSFLKISIEK